MTLVLRAFLSYLLLLPVATLAADSRASQLVEFTAAELSLIKSFGPWPIATPSDPGNELSGVAWAESLGEVLFNDSGLSGDGKLACSSCHLSSQGFTDGKSLAEGKLKHVRNTQGLLDVGLQRWLGWDGGADSLWAASLRPLLSEVEMAADIPSLAATLKDRPHVSEAFSRWQSNEFSDEEWVVLASKAIAAYTRTLISSRTPFDDFYNAVLTNNSTAISQYPIEAKRGLKIFLSDANCHVCHFGPNFSNGEFHDTGRSFFTGVGRVDPGRYTGIKRVRQDPYNLLGRFNGTGIESETMKTRTVKLGQANFGQWRTPSLRNLMSTAPYMHDGSVGSLRAVVDSYADIDPDRLHSKGESILKPLNLSTQDRNDLVSFLESLSVK